MSSPAGASQETDPVLTQAQTQQASSARARRAAASRKATSKDNASPQPQGIQPSDNLVQLRDALQEVLQEVLHEVLQAAPQKPLLVAAKAELKKMLCPALREALQAVQSQEAQEVQSQAVQDVQAAQEEQAAQEAQAVQSQEGQAAQAAQEIQEAQAVQGAQEAQEVRADREWQTVQPAQADRLDPLDPADQAKEPLTEAAGELAEQVAKKEAELAKFLTAYEGGIRQRGQEWYKLMGTTVGGSELANLMKARHAGFCSVVDAKLALLQGGAVKPAGGVPCWWGSLFEDELGAYVSADLATRVVGDSICVQAYEGHRNSPDGYAVVRFDERGAVCKAGQRIAPGSPQRAGAVLLEFKCPYTRVPSGAMPPQYVMQVKSGLSVSPFAELGLFVEGVFRKCTLSSFERADTGYDKAYHAADPPEIEREPLACGLIGVYAGEQETAGWLSREGWHDRTAQSLTPGAPDVTLVDLGRSRSWLFQSALRKIDSGELRVARQPPWLAASGAACDSRAMLERLPGLAPGDGWALCAVLPWKLFVADYYTVARDPKFMDTVMPKIQAVHARVKAAVESGDPLAYMANYRASGGAG